MHKMKPAQTRSGLRQPTGLRLRAPFGSNYLVEPDDILDTKRALMALDYYQPLPGTEPGAFVDNDLFAGIKAFQKDHGLKVDGLMRPGGETETTLNAALRHADPSRPIPDGEGANDNQPPANENEPGWDEAAKGKRRPRGGDDNRGGSTDRERKDRSPSIPNGIPNGQCYGQYMTDMAKCDSLWDYETDIDMNRYCKEVASERMDNCRFKGEWDEPPLPRWRVHPKRNA